MIRWKTLVVDDQAEITASLEKQILQKGFEVKVAHNYNEAMFMIDHYSFDIAVIDIFLPDGNGIDLYRELKKRNEEIYSIIITGDATIENAVTSLNEGVNAFLVKPFSDEQLKANLLQAESSLKLKLENQLLNEEIKKNQQFYEDLLNSSSEAILVVDLDFNIQYSNNTAQKILNINEDQLKEQPLHFYIEDGYKVLTHIYQQLVVGKAVAGYRVGIKTPNNKTFDAHLSADFLHGKDDRLEGLIVNLSNTMIHNELFNRILRKEKLSTIIKLANSLSHEIRNPINILYGRLQLLAEEIDEEKFNHAYDSIRRQIERLSSITSLLGKFNFSREDSIPEILSVTQVLNAVIEDEEGPVASQKHRIITHFDQKEDLVEGNHLQFTDAFHYLMKAIMEFTTEEDKIEIRSKTKSGYGSPPWVELKVRIPGVQLSSDQLFDPYHAMDMKANGLIGLELTIMHTIFTNYGAKVDLTIQNGSGTLLRIRFPIYQEKPNNHITEKAQVKR